MTAKKPELVVYAKSITGFWKRVGCAWRNKTRDKTGYLKIQLDFIPPGGELTLWNVSDRPYDLDPEEKQENQDGKLDTRGDLAPTLVEEAD